MATYAELIGERDNQTKRDQVNVALTIIAADISQNLDTTDPPYDQAAGAHDNRKAWVVSNDVFNPTSELIDRVWNAMLALNESATLASIQTATDSSVKTNCEKVVDILAGN